MANINIDINLRLNWVELGDFPFGRSESAVRSEKWQRGWVKSPGKSQGKGGKPEGAGPYRISLCYQKLQQRK